MAIRIECSKCGFQNELGRIFCAHCGVKLDLSATSVGELRSQREIDVAGLVGRILTPILLGLLILVVAAAVWPDPGPTVLSDKAGAIQVPIKAKAVRTAITYGKPTKLDLSEGELNGFLEERGKNRKIDRLVIDLKPGVFNLYAVQVWMPITNVTWLAGVRVPFSLGMSGSFHKGVMAVEGAHVGHLPLPGFARSAVVKFFAELFADITREQRLVSSLKTVAIEETKADLMLGPE